jgi:Protein of unknown function (DUF3761)
VRVLVTTLIALATGCATVQQPQPSAVCRDGSLSYSAHRSGTCSSHEGVSKWLVDLPP